MKRGRTWWMLLLLLPLGMSPLHAEVIPQKLGTGVTATAEYRPGDPGRPAVLILHGFLQTRDFSTVRRLADAVHDRGFSVLTPTLRLGIDARAQSLPCEAIHTHTMDQSVDELAQWVTWLADQGHARIVLIGHSSGSATEAIYLATRAHPKVTQAILLSLVPFGPGPLSFETEAHAAAARQALARGADTLGTYALAYCRRYPAPPASFLSYYDWSRTRMAEVLAEIEVPLHVVIGGGDQRMTAPWMAALRDSPAEVMVVEGANHFFHDMHEFDMLETVEPLLTGTP